MLAPFYPEQGSKGNKNPAVLKYDPSGLRTSMTATWAEMDKALERDARPNHLVRPHWEGQMEEIQAECDRKGIPHVPGKRFKFKTTAKFNDVKW